MKQLSLLDDVAVQVKSGGVPAGTDRARLEDKFAPLMREDLAFGKLVTYVRNKTVPVLGLYRYKEAFALSFVDHVLSRFELKPGDVVFDPFCGMGTTMFGAALRGITSVGVDRLPFAVFVANTIPKFLRLAPGEIRDTFELLQGRVAAATPAPIADDVAIMGVAFPDESLLQLRQWKTVIEELDAPLADVFLLLLFSVLEECSYTSKDGQFLRLLKDKALATPASALEAKVQAAERDIQLLRQLGWHERDVTSRAYLGDTRDLTSLQFERAPTAIITSPPYPNRYDYTRTYSLELCFHFVRDFPEMRALRSSILRSHIETKISPDESPPHPSVEEVVDFLEARRGELNNPRIPDMLTGYFVDMEKAIGEWARVLAPGANVAVVIDNVRFEGQLLPVDLVLSEMAEDAGFTVEEIIVARYKGNSSQQMGKYGRVPVRESVLIWNRA